MKIDHITAWKADSIRRVRQRAREEEREIRDKADRLIVTAIETAKEIEPNRRRISRRLGLNGSTLQHYARRLGVKLPPTYNREAP